MRISLAVVLSVAGSLGAGPALAACSVAYVFDSKSPSPLKSFVFTPGICDGGTPCADTSVTPDFTGAFWRLGHGDPAPAAGSDNGTYPAQDDATNSWTRHGVNKPTLIDGYWSEPRIDGCVDQPPGEPRCMALLLGDAGHFAFLTAEANEIAPLEGDLGTDSAGNLRPNDHPCP